MMDSRKKFSGKAEVYQESRPRYPQALYQYFRKHFLMGEGAAVADIGSGTGILTKELLKMGCVVYGVEPNDDMRRTAEKQLASYDGYTSIAAAAEHTTLPDHSMDFVIAAQAFHWFNVAQFHKECYRILKPNAMVALVWNFRDETADIMLENKKICEKYCKDFHGFSGGIHNRLEKVDCFFDGDYQTICFQNPVYYTKEQFIKRNLSSSFSIGSGEDNFDDYCCELANLFDVFSQKETVCILYQTVCYFKAFH